MTAIFAFIAGLFGAGAASGGGAVTGAAASTMGGIPLEVFTMLGSSLLSGLMTIWSQSIKAKQAHHEMMIDTMKTNAGIVQQARQYGTRNPKFEFTRRTIAIMTVFAVVLLPKLAALFFPLVPVEVGYTEFHPGFWFFTSDHVAIAWHAARGFVITPLDTNLMAAIAGLYFGASVVKNA